MNMSLDAAQRIMYNTVGIQEPGALLVFREYLRVLNAALAVLEARSIDAGTVARSEAGEDMGG